MLSYSWGRRLFFETSLPGLFQCFYSSSSISVIESFPLSFPILILSLSRRGILTNLEYISVKKVTYPSNAADELYTNWEKSGNPQGHGEVVGTKRKASPRGIIQWFLTQSCKFRESLALKRSHIITHVPFNKSIRYLFVPDIKYSNSLAIECTMANSSLKSVSSCVSEPEYPFKWKVTLKPLLLWNLTLHEKVCSIHQTACHNICERWKIKS